MVETVRLQPHDPLPSPAEDHILVVSRMAETDPQECIVELSVNSPSLRAGPTAASRAPNGPKSLDEGIAMAEGFARERGIPKVYAVDRTAGEVESEVFAKGQRNLEDRHFKDLNT